jgi:L-lactate dehydrogenase
MKVGIVGVGQVGRACALALVGRGCARYIVLVDRTRSRAEAVATDIRYGLPLLPRAEIGAGDYDDLAHNGNLSNGRMFPIIESFNVLPELTMLA